MEAMRAGRWIIACVAALAAPACAALTSLDHLRGDAGDASDASTIDVDAAAIDAGRDVQKTSYRAIVMGDKPISYFRFGEKLLEAGPVDEEAFVVGVYAGAALGVPGAIANDPNTAAAFDGGGSGGALFGNVFELAGKVPFTFEAWVLPTARPMTGNVIDRLQTTSNGWWLATGTSGQVQYARINGDASTSPFTQQALPLDVYSYVVVTYDGTTVTIYVNAAIGQTATNVIAAPANTANVGIGNGWAGSLDEVAIYDHALTPAQVLAHYQVGTGVADF